MKIQNGLLVDINEIDIENGPVTIPESVTRIGDGAFDGCTGLTSVTIPDSVTHIGVGAFDGCTGLTDVIIPASVTHIGNGAFEGCTGLDSGHYPRECHPH